MSLSSSAIETSSHPDGLGTYLPLRPTDSANTSPVDLVRTTIDDAEERGFKVLRAVQLSQLIPYVLAAKPTSTSKERSSNLPPTNPVYEKLYFRIGRWVGPFASPDAKRVLLLEWNRYGADGAFWIVQQIRHDRNLDALEGAAAVLISMGSVAAPYLIGALKTSVQENDTESSKKYLRVLEWFAREDVAPWSSYLRAMFDTLSRSGSRELREAAYQCISLLSDPVDFSKRALAAEQDPDLRCFLEEQQGKSG